MRHARALLFVLAGAISWLPGNAFAQQKFADVPEDIPYLNHLAPRKEEPVFAVCTKQGMRVLVSRDDGKSWKQTFLGTDALEDGGWHGTFAVYGMASTNGVIGVFSGWGTPGVYIGSDDGEHWTHLTKQPAKLGSVWAAAAGNGIVVTSADQWRGITVSGEGFSDWHNVSVKSMLNGGKTHHMISGFGNYQGGRFLVVGDNHHVFFTDDNCRSWKHSTIPEAAGGGQDAIAYGNGVFLISYKHHVARSADGGASWTLHETGLKGRGKSWRGLSFVRNEFWLTAQQGSHVRKSPDGINWSDAPSGTPGGCFIEGESGTLINVERRRYDIKRSLDGLRWETVFTAPEENASWDTTFAVFEKVNKPEANALR